MSREDFIDLVSEVSDLLDSRINKIDDKEEAFRVLVNVCVQMSAFPLAYLDDQGRDVYRQVALEKIPEVMRSYQSYCARQEAH